MSNRNLNGLSSSVRSLNGLSTKLKDGKAIKISNKNEIDVNFLTNTTEKTTLGDTDLFLLSDNLGSNIQYINGLRIKQQINNSLVAGNNINFTTSGNHRQINVNSDLTSIVSIDSTSGLILKNSSVNRVSIGSASTRFFPLNSTLGGILLIDKGTGGQTNSENYEILQDYLSNGFINNKIDVGIGIRIRRKGNDNYDQFFCGNQQDGGKCVIINPNNDLHYIFKSGELKISKPDLSAHDFSINLGNSASTFSVNNIATATLDCNTFKTCNSRLVAIRDSNDLYLFNNATLPAEVGNNNEFLKQSGDGSNLLLRANTIQFFNGTTEIMSLSSSTVDVKKILTVSADGITNSSSLNLKISNTNKISILSNTIDIFSNTDFNQNILYLKGGGNANHYIRFRDVANIINGPRISGYGGAGRAVFDVVSQVETTDEVLFNILNDRINMYKPLYMNSEGLSGSSTNRPIYLHFNQDFYIKYQDDNGQNVVECKGYNGVHLGAKANNSVSLKVEQSRVQLNSAPLRMNNNNIELATGSTTDFIQAVVNNGVRILGSGATATRVFTVESSAVPTFLIECWDFRVYLYKGKFQISNTSGGQNLDYYADAGTANFHNGNGRLAWQSDRNLVIYDTGNNAIFSSGTSVSERRFKDNIVSLNLENSYNIIKQLNPVSFVYKEDINTPKKGFIVDEIEDKIPECIKAIDNCGECENEIVKLLYKEDIVPDLVASVKYLINKVETLEQQLLTQSNLISNLQSQINI